MKSLSLPIATTHPYFSFSFFRCKEEEVLLAGVDPVASTLFCCPTYEQLVLPDNKKIVGPRRCGSLVLVCLALQKHYDLL